MEHDSRIDPDFIPDYEALREEWTCSNAFVARLVTRQCQLFDLYVVYAIHTMRAALEEELHADELWINVPAAAVWMFYAGDFIFNNERQWEVSAEGKLLGHRSTAYGGELCQGKTGFCKERWKF